MDSRTAPNRFLTHLQKGRLAALAGGCFIGTGCGLVVRQGASCAGDDALALVISKVTGCRISRAYLLTDVSVLVLSLSYIPAVRIVYSLITVIVSSFMIDFIQNFGVHKEDENSGKVRIKIRARTLTSIIPATQSS